VTRIAIIGAGLGGLAAALFLRRAGLQATVYEQAQELRDVGAGIVVSPNMVRVLDRLGLATPLPQFAVRLDAAWEFRRWQDGRVLFAQPMGEQCERLYGAHCYVAHRADLLSLLRQALPAELLRLDHRCTGLQQDEREVTLDFTRRDGTQARATADVVIGADGIHSTLQAMVAPQVDVRFSGLCAFRCLVPADKAPAMSLRPVQTLWLGPGRHFVHYPISGGRHVNVVAIVPAGAWRIESWTADGNIADLSAEFEAWDERVQQLIVSASSTKRWALNDRNPLERWSVGRVTLLGDAAHPMYPIGSNGASQAILDGEAITQELAVGDDPEKALRRYEERRLPPTARIVESNRRKGIDVMLDIVEQRAPQGFDNLESVLPADELERIVGDYKKLVAQDRETLLKLAAQ